MKKFRMILIVLGLISLSTTFAVTPNYRSVSAYFIQRDSEVTQSEIVIYLEDTGHEILSKPYSTDGGYTWICTTRIGHTIYTTTVFTDGVSIVGYEDEQLG